MSKKKNERKPIKQAKHPDTGESGETYDAEQAAVTITTNETATNTPGKTVTAIIPTGNGSDRPANTRTASDRNTPPLETTVFGNTGQTGSTIDGPGQEYETPPQDIPDGAYDPAVTSRIESLERAVQNLIQLVESNHNIPQNGAGGWEGALKEGLGFLNKLIGSEGGGENSLSAQLFQSEIEFNKAVKFALLRNLGAPLPAEHMIIKQ